MDQEQLTGKVCAYIINNLGKRGVFKLYEQYLAEDLKFWRENNIDYKNMKKPMIASVNIQFVNE